ncbi:MAG: PQQ-binding-like beta-propeller repeat protein, partial [Anaerolineae bacterium]
MRRPAALLLLVCLSTLSLLAACNPTPASPAALAPTATLAWTETPVPSPRPSATHTPSPEPSPTRIPAPSSTTSPSFSPVPPTPTPTAPPLLAPISGDPLSLSLGWRFDANAHLASGLVLETGGRPLFLLASLGRTVYALTEGGQVAWTLRMTGPVYALAGLEGAQAAAGDDAGNLKVFSADGEVLWQAVLGSRITALHGGWQHGLLAGGWDERLSFLKGGGELHWQAYLDGPVSGIASLPDLALVSTLKGEVAAFDGTGAEMWRLRLGAPVTSIGATSEGATALVLVALQDGQLVALSPEGTQRWRQRLDREVLGAPGGPVWHTADLSGDTGTEIVAGIGGTEPLLAMISADGEILWRRVLPSAPNMLVSLD